MNRQGNSTPNRRRNEADYSGPSYSDLPDHLLETILLSLSIKRIFICKCVCKSWYRLISDPKFAKLHFNQARVCPLLRTSRFTLLSRMLYLVQPENTDFESKLEMSYDSAPIRFKLDCKLKLPLRNIQMILDKEESGSENCIKLDMKNHKCNIVNSCNGLLCLSDPSHRQPVIVCNPVTGEFINLPEVRTVNVVPSMSITACALGFSPATDKYKVVRMLKGYNSGIVAEVHTLGTETWRVIPVLPDSIPILFPTYLNGSVYWLYRSRPWGVLSFDIEKECFESIPVPQLDDYFRMMGVLGGDLFLNDYESPDVRYWAMKDNGGKKSWSQIFSFEVGDARKWPHGPHLPIKYLNNGALLMFHPQAHALTYKDPRKKGCRYLKVCGFKCAFQATAHTPSFVPLKYALSGGDMNVLNVNSRCGKLKLHGENRGISIVEERADLDMIMKIGTAGV